VYELPAQLGLSARLRRRTIGFVPLAEFGQVLLDADEEKEREKEKKKERKSPEGRDESSRSLLTAQFPSQILSF
jgi:hypothetical protein